MKTRISGLRRARVKRDYLRWVVSVFFTLVLVSTPTFADRDDDKDRHDKSSTVISAAEALITISGANYNASKKTLTVDVLLGGNGRRTVYLFNDRTDERLAKQRTRDLDVRFRVRRLSAEEVPCEVRVETEGQSAVSTVANRPDSCGVEPPPPSPALTTRKSLVSNADEDGSGNVTPGDTLTFAVEVSNTGNVSLNNVEALDGMITPASRQCSTVAVGENCTLTGTYQVTQSDADAGNLSNTGIGHSDETGPVNDVLNTTVNQPQLENRDPVCSILEPAAAVSILLNESVYFLGEATDPDGDAMTYEWDFGGGADSRPLTAEAGNILFDVQAGNFTASFSVRDGRGGLCTDNVAIQVGQPPTDLPPKVSEQPAPGTALAGDGDNVVLPFNDLGMHCADLGSYPFSILPPFNTVNVQVVRKGTTGSNRPQILDGSRVTLKYSAASNPLDPVGPDSINSTSRNWPPGALAGDATVRKTDFWDDFDGVNSIVELLFPGLFPVPDEGLQTIANSDHGRYMPGINDPYYLNDPQDFSGFDATHTWFTAQGIPMTSIDDQGRFNSYPLMRVQALDELDNVVATTDVVVPVSTEVDCRDCHALGKVGANSSARQGFGAPVFIDSLTADRVDVEAAAKHNILVLHDYKHNTDFVAVDQPVLCASCHRSNALAEVGGPGGVAGIKNMSNVMHGMHGRLQVDETGALLRTASGEPLLIEPSTMTWNEQPLIATGEGIPMEQNCFNCHPGKITQCFRGAMYTAGQKCDDCHGDMLAMGAEFPLETGGFREPWADEPKCSSCHSGNGHDPIGTLAYDPTDPAATPIELVGSRFAENPGTLYRNSLDNHAGIACEACHGSPHAIWPNRDPDSNDNVTANQLQGHAGTIRECSVCHEANSFPNGTLNGPHGMHPVNDPNWIKSKGDFYHEDFVFSNGQDRCAACHGADHLGTRLSRVPVDRVLRDADGVVRARVSAGDIISCDLCHSLSKSFED